MTSVHFPVIIFGFLSKLNPTSKKKKKIEEYSFWVEGQNPLWWGSKFSSTGLKKKKKSPFPKGLTSFFFFFLGLCFQSNVGSR